MVEREGYAVSNIDCLIIADEPKLTPYKNKMKENIALLLNITPEDVNIKATRSEGLGSLADSKGLAAQATVLLHKNK